MVKKIITDTERMDWLATGTNRHKVGQFISTSKKWTGMYGGKWKDFENMRDAVDYVMARMKKSEVKHALR